MQSEISSAGISSAGMTPSLEAAKAYHLRCTLTFGDIYGQILIWMLVIFVSLAAGLALPDHQAVGAADGRAVAGGRHLAEILAHAIAGLEARRLHAGGRRREAIRLREIGRGILIGEAGAGLLLGLVVAHNLESVRQLINRSFGLNVFDPNLYLLSRLPSVVVTSDVVLIVSLSLSLSLLATIYPAWRAAKLDPVEALRYE